MLIFGIVVAYLVVGLVAGGAVARVGYARDKSVKNALEEFIRHRDREGRRDSYYFNEAQKAAKVAIKRAKNFWFTWGVISIFLYPVLLPSLLIGSIAYAVYVLAARGLMYAITPTKAKEDQLVVVASD